MTDLEMTKLCAEAMGFSVCITRDDNPNFDHYRRMAISEVYDPLHDNAQAMALVKKLKLCCAWQPNIGDWWVHPIGGKPESYAQDLNRAIVECCARMQKANNDAKNKD